MFPRFENLIPEQMDHIATILGDCGWLHPRRAAECLVELRRLWDECVEPAEFPPEWYIILTRVLKESFAPTATLESTCEFVRVTKQSGDAFRLFSELPRSLDILARFSIGSPYLTQVLLRDPEALPFLARHRRISELKSRNDFCEEAGQQPADDARTVLLNLRLYQRREQLRIGMCDVFGLLSLRHVTLQLSLLADAIVRVCLESAMKECGVTEPPFAVLALGKHGGEELNYSSDIDLVLVADRLNSHSQIVARRMVDGLHEHLGTGFLYRVDLRLRPWGNAGPLVTTIESWLDYLNHHAQLWEKQALLKARFVTGNAAVADHLLSEIPQLLFTESAKSIRTDIRKMKDRIELSLRSKGRTDTEVKLGSGSIRDVEFIVQSLQLIHGAAEPRIASANTLEALIRLTDFGLLSATEFRQLRDGYVFLRAIEHALQMQHNRQTHEIPWQPELRKWLALRVDYPDATAFMKRFDEHRRAIRRIFDRNLRSDQSAAPPRTSTSTVQFVRKTTVPETDRTEDRTLGALRRQLQDLTDGQAITIDQIEVNSRRAVLVICMPEHPEMLTMVSGVLFSQGLDIRQGAVATGPGSLHGLDIPSGIFAGRLLIESQSSNSLPEDLHRLVHAKIEQLITINRQDGRGAVRQELIDLFCQRMEATTCSDVVPSDVSIVDHPAANESATVVNISSTDSPGFLFELCNALNLCGFRVRQARIDAVKEQIHDEFWITELDRQQPLHRVRIQEIHTAVILIQQFMLWLPTTAVPGPALLRFRRLLQHLLRDSDYAENAQILRNPEVLQRVARVLGLSRHLWEDALHHDSHLIAFLTAPEQLQQPDETSALRREAQTVVEHTRNSSDNTNAAAALNQFKDTNLFRIELRHVLGYCQAFGEFSREITALAEVCMEMAVETAWEELLTRNDNSVPVPDCPWTLVGLGKFGGVEMGYGSDIEMLLVYDSPNQQRFGRWFEILITRAVEIVTSRRDGIFEIDLRMRPWGHAGSAAISLEQFENYYSETGSAWPYERQALIKMRSFGRDPSFGKTVTDVRDRVIYDGRPFDFSAMDGLREQQVRQHVQPGTIHVKLSEGCLVDLEYSVQAFQLTYGRHHHDLRTVNTLEALQAIQHTGLVPKEICGASISSYMYFRQLIDCLRMVRGNAKDLMIPAEGSDEWQQLERRLARIYSDDVSLCNLNHHRRVVGQLGVCVRNVSAATDTSTMDDD
ncbi:MAG: hypothetical protein MK102_03035 [Fuerstiella sp.]|nr:hypothetical protein [Fuerstiella sp.]